jgi:hypothetical protein
MIRIRGPTDALAITDHDLRNLIELRLSQLSDGETYDPDRHGELFVVEQHDRSDDIESAVGFPVLANPIDGTRYGDDDFTPASEVIESHPTSFEIVFAVHDDFGFAVFVPKHPAVDPLLLSMCTEFSVPAAHVRR